MAAAASTLAIRPFWKTHDPESQWHPSEYVLDDTHYIHAEQGMMTGKARLFGDKVTESKILKAKNARTIKDLGREVKPFDDEVWLANCYRIVYLQNYAKFAQNPKLREYLLGTGEAELIECSPYDRLYGVGYDEKNLPADRTKWGKNYLGLVLMDVRDRLRRESPEDSARLSLLSSNSPSQMNPRVTA